MGDPFEDLFRERLNGHGETPPAGAWHRIQEDLHRASKPKPALGWWLAPALLLLLAVTVFLFKEFALPSKIAADGKNAPVRAEKTKSATAAAPNGHAETSTGARPNSQPPSGVTTIPDASGNLSETGATPNRSSLSASDFATAQPVAKPGKGSQGKTTVGLLALSDKETNRKPGKRTTGKKRRSSGAISTIVRANPNLVAQQAEMARNSAGSNKNSINYSVDSEANQNDQPLTNIISPETTGTEAATTAASNLAETPYTHPATDSLVAADSVKNAIAGIADSAATATTDSVAPFRPKTRFGFYTGTQLTTRTLSPNQTDEMYINKVEQKGNTSPERLKVSAGVLVQRSLTKNLSAELGAGVLYSRDQLEYEATLKEITHLQTSFTATGLALTPTHAKEQHHYDNKALYSSIRTGFVYTAIRSPFAQVSLTGGGSLHLLTWHKSETVVNNQVTESSTFKPNKVQSGLYGGIRFTTSLGRNLDIALEPGLSYYFNTWNKQDQALRIRTQTYNLNLLFYFR